MSWEIPDIEGEIKLLGERYLLYGTNHIVVNNLMMQMFDLDAGEDISGWAVDSRKERGKPRQRNDPVFDDTAGQAAYDTWWFEGDELTLTVIRPLEEA